MTETYLSEDVTWPTFIRVCSKEMNLREDSVPEFSWKFSNGTGSKVWTTLSESSYHRMMEAAAKRIQARAKKEGDLKDPDLGFGWWVDLMLENEVEMIQENEVEMIQEEDGNSYDEVALAKEEKKGAGKKKKKLKGKIHIK